MQNICLDYLLISSNSRKIYQENVFNGISYPNNYIIQYRYDLKYLEKELYDAIFNEGIYYIQSTLNNFFKNKKCALSYFHIEGVKTELFLFRRGIIKHAVYNSDINRLLLFIELKEFLELEDNTLTIDFKNSIIDKFNDFSTCVFDLQSRGHIFENIKTAKFHQIAYIFSSLIQAKLFYTVTLKEKFNDFGINEYSRVISPVLDLSTNLSKYKLIDGSNYFLEILTFEVDNSKYQLPSKKNTKEKSNFKVEISSESITINQHILDSGSFNLNYIDLMIKPISSETVNTSIKLIEPQTGFITNILIDIKKSKFRSILFALSSFIVLVTVPIANIFKNFLTSSNNNINISPFFIFSFIVFILFVTGSLRFLYRYFDKK